MRKARKYSYYSIDGGVNREQGLPLINDGYGKKWNSRVSGKLQKLGVKNLVPFAEYVPFFQNWLTKINQFDDMGSFTPGENYNTFEINNIKSSIMICYDSSSYRIAKKMVDKGAEIIFVITNDSYVGKAMPYQHFEHAKLRAIELGIPIVQSANNGISGIILPSGEVLMKSDIDERNVFNYSIKLK